MVLRARENSFNINFYSPFMKEAEEAGIEGIFGGKPDDITVIVA